MKSFRKELWFEVPTRRVEACLRESGIKEGLVLVNYNAYLVYPNAISFLIRGQIAKRALIRKAGANCVTCS